MAPPNATWREILAEASQSAEVLRQPDVVRNVHTILSTNVSVCQSLGHPFIHQMQHIYMDMLQVYRCARPPSWHLACLCQISTDVRGRSEHLTGGMRAPSDAVRLSAAEPEQNTAGVGIIRHLLYMISSSSMRFQCL